MLHPADIFSVALSKPEIEFLRRQGKKAEIGGRSHVCADDADRSRNLEADQLVGMIGAYVGHKVMFGHTHLFRLSRWFADLDPTRGDGGSDVPGANIDFKASLLRSSRRLIEHRLFVRMNERHPGTVYVLILVEQDFSQAHIVGWIKSEDLPKEARDEFPGRLTVDAADLNPVMPVRWF